jgi:hypothetical protein
MQNEFQIIWHLTKNALQFYMIFAVGMEENLNLAQY